ncbi:S-layer homology domain-containing protein [Sporosarcina sp. NPDC096371]|uniref:S-layer homology domain-containing protein n=1 Tax=Sporosarcina sp. NPDC096371 TaxID=3364530 RepID=UPI003814D148
MKKIVSVTLAVLLLSFAIKGPSASAAFTDVGGNYREAVDYIVSQKYANGISSTKFGTQASIKRIDAAVMVARAIGINENTKSPSAGFTDVPKNRAWAVNALASRGIISGKKTGTYGSEDSMTRSEMAKVLASAYNLQTDKTTIPFTDVSPRFVPYVAALVDNGITFGKTNKSFGGSDKIKRGEFALFIFRADGLSKIEPPNVESVT